MTTMNNYKKPVISIIIASFNSGQTLEYTLRSVIEQDYPHKQLIVIDGGSKDESVSILKKYQSDISYWISEPDRGIAHAWNKGLAQAKGEWICFLGADDVFWNATVLTRMVPHLVNQPENIRLVYGTLVLLSHNLDVMGIRGAPWQELKRKFIGGVMRVPHPGSMHHHSLFKERGLFNEQLKIAIDYELLLRELRHNDAYFVQDIIVAGMLEIGMTNQLKNRLATLQEARQARQINGLRRWCLENSLDWLQSVVVVVIMPTLLGQRLTDHIRTRFRRWRLKDKSLRLKESRPSVYQ
jgi:hypothetical protein